MRKYICFPVILLAGIIQVGIAQNVGIGTNDPQALLHVAENNANSGNVLFTGTQKNNPGPPPASGPGTRMMWFPDKEAFRAGRTTGFELILDTIGMGSVAFGRSTAANGFGSFAAGYSSYANEQGAVAIGGNNDALGEFAVAIGGYASALGRHSFATGDLSEARGFNSIAFAGGKSNGDYCSAFGAGTAAAEFAFANGANNKAYGVRSTAYGENTIANAYASFNIGIFNDTIVPVQNELATSPNLSAPLFIVGNGNIATQTRRNAFVVGYNGRLGIDNANNPSYRISIVDNNLGIDRPAGNTMAFYTNGAERLRINPEGRLGIGASNPGYLLHLRGPNDPNTGAVIALMGNSPDQEEAGRIRFLDGTAASNWRGGYMHYNGATDRLSIGTHNTSDNDPASDVNAITIVRSTRLVGMGTDSPSERLDVDGNARFRTIGSGASAGALHRTSNGTLTTSTSDARLKTDIVPIENALQKAMGMRGVTFRWMQDPALGQRIGFIAQEVEKVAPELVFTNEADGLKGVHYPETTALLLEALKQQQEMIEGMKEAIEKLKAINEKLNARIEILETIK